MKTTPEIESNLLVDSKSGISPIATAPQRATYKTGRREQTVRKAPTAVPAAKKLPQLSTFRALSRQVFGAEAGKEYLQEAIVFACMMVVAAWPLSVTLNQLGTMMISPPNALW